MSSGDAAGAVLASAAIPGVLPPVVRQGRTLVDGGARNNTPLSQAQALGADEIYILPTGYACLLPCAPRTALGIAMHALTLLIEQRLIDEVARFPGPDRLRVLPPLCPLGISSTDFGHASEMITRAQRATGQRLDSGGPALPAPERFLSLHAHGPISPVAAVPKRRAPRST